MVAGRGGGGDGQDWLQRHGGLQVVIKQPLYTEPLNEKFIRTNTIRTGRLLQNKLPGSQVRIYRLAPILSELSKVLAMLGESLVPEPAREFFNVVSAAVSNISFAFTWP